MPVLYCPGPSEWWPVLTLSRSPCDGAFGSLPLDFTEGEVAEIEALHDAFIKWQNEIDRRLSAARQVDASKNYGGNFALLEDRSNDAMREVKT